MKEESAISMRGLSKSYGAIRALQDVSIELEPGCIHALLGENSAGKSTLLQILAGLESADSGTIGIDPADVALARQQGSLIDELSVLENYALAQPGLGRVAWDKLAAAAQDGLRELGLDLDVTAPVAQLDAGSARLVEYARVLWLGRQLVLLDEPAAMLNQIQAQRLFAAIERRAGQGTTFLISSHRVAELLELVSHAHVLRRGSLVKSAKRTDLDIAAVGAAMFGEAAPESRDAPAPAQDAGDVVLSVHGLKLDAYPAAQVDVQVRQGEIVAVVGMAGNGQRQLLEALCGLAAPASGSIDFNGAPLPPGNLRQQGLGRLPEDIDASTAPTMTVTENATMHEHIVRGWRRGMGWVSWRACAAATAALIRSERLAIDSAQDEFAWLSGGNQRKLLLAREGGDAVQLLILHNPEAGLDLQATSALLQRLQRWRSERVAVLLIAEDLDFVAQAADRILLIERGSLSDLEPATWREDFQRRVNG